MVIQLHRTSPQSAFMFVLKKFAPSNAYALAFCFTVVMFIIAKLPVLHIPYYWDEIGVYVPGMREIVHKQTLGILPGDLDPLYSRGHPMLFYFIGATCFRFFGDNIITGHLLAIGLAVCTLIAFYKMCVSIGGERAGLAASIALVCQPLYFAMSGILLPEMLLTMGGILSLWGILSKRWNLFAIGSTLGILTKETGIVFLALGVVIFFADAIRSKDFFNHKHWKLSLYVAFPCLTFATFLIIQHRQHGWFFFPEHIGLMHFSFSSLLEKSREILFQLFFDQGRWWLSLVMLMALLIFYKQIFKHKGKRIVFVVLVFVLLSTLFCSVNFFVHRYQLYAYPAFILMSIVALEVIIDRIDSNKWPLIYLPFLCGVAWLGYSHMNNHRYHDTYSMTYLTTIHCVQQCISWSESHPLVGKVKADFPLEQAMEDKRNGYTDQHFALIKGWDIKPDYHYIFYLDGEQAYDQWRFDSVVQTFDIEFAHIKLLTQKKIGSLRVEN